MTSNDKLDPTPKGRVVEAQATSIGTLHKKAVLDAHERLLQKIASLQSNLNSKSTTASIISIVQKYHCLMRCQHDISNPSYDNNIDPLYTAKHEFVKNKLIDTLFYKFGNLMMISSEHTIKAGKLDIAIFPDRILLKSNNKNIAIGIKSGKSIGLFQIERYLFESDILIVVRVPTQDVFRVDALSPENELLRSIDLITDKIEKILSGNIYKVRGDGCRGCTAQCEYCANSRWSNNSNHGPQLEFETFAKNTYKVIDKVIPMVEFELFGEPL
jgi:hypothetical protein